MFKQKNNDYISMIQNIIELDGQYQTKLVDQIIELNRDLRKSTIEISNNHKTIMNLKNTLNKLEKDINSEFAKCGINDDFSKGAYAALKYVKERIKELKEVK